MHRILRSPEQLASVLNGVADAITAQDKTGQVIYANDAAVRTLGYPSSEVLRNTPVDEIAGSFDMLTESGQPLPAAQLPGRAALQGLPSPDQVVHFRVRSTGEERWAIVKARPVYNQDGGVEFVVNIFQDITRLKQTEKSLDEQREQFRVTLLSIGDGVIATDTAGRITLMNPVAELLTGFRQGEAQGKPLQDVFRVINEHTRQPVDNPVLLTLERSAPTALANNSILVSQHGAEIPIEDSSAPIRTGEGALAGAVLVFHDVTERRRADAELREREARFRTMADHAPVLIWMAGTDQRFDYFNKPWLEFTGRTLAEELESGWMDGIHPGDYDRCLTIYTTSFASRQPFTMEYRLRNKDGHYGWILNNGVPRFAPDGRFEGYIGSCIDITERKQHEERTLLLQAVTAALASAVTVEQVADTMASQVMSAMGARMVAVTLLSADGQFLETVNTIGVPPDMAESLARIPVFAAMPLAEAVQTRKPVWIETPQSYHERYPEFARQDTSGSQAAACVPLMIQNRVIGSVGIGFPRPRRLDAGEQASIAALAQQCEQALERARVYAEAQNLAAMNERQRLARDLHDAVSQTLFSANIIAESLPRLWEQAPPAKILLLLEQLHLLNRGAMAEMRTLLVELRPESLLNTRFETLLSQLVDTTKVRKKMDIALQINLEERQALPPEVHIAFYRIAQEALTNIIKHSKATEVTITYGESQRRVELSVNDNGDGFNTRTVAQGIGMVSMRERAEAIQARLRVTSRKGRGTQVSVVWPRP